MKLGHFPPPTNLQDKEALAAAMKIKVHPTIAQTETEHSRTLHVGELLAALACHTRRTCSCLLTTPQGAYSKGSRSHGRNPSAGGIERTLLLRAGTVSFCTPCCLWSLAQREGTRGSQKDSIIWDQVTAKPIYLLLKGWCSRDFCRLECLWLTSPDCKGSDHRRRN